MNHKTSFLIPLFKFIVRNTLSSTPAWVLLGLVLIASPFLISQSDINELQEAAKRNQWLLSKPFFPDWFAYPIWILFLWLVLNVSLFFAKWYFCTIKFFAKIPYFSVPFLILSVSVVFVYSAYDSDYLRQLLHTQRESYLRDPAELKSIREKQIPTDPDSEQYEKQAAAKPVHSRVRGRLWEVPESVLSRFTALSYKYSGGRYKDTTINYRLHIPDNLESGKKYPLLIWLHGIGEAGNDNISQLAHMEPLIPFITGKQQRKFFILATQCPADNKMWDNSKVDISKSKDDTKGDAQMTITMEILDEVIRKNYPVDNNAISIFGISSGGYGVMTMAIKFPGRFATLFPIACNPHRNLHKYTIDHNTALWMLNNAGDKDIVFSRIEEEVEQIHGKNGTAYMTKFDNKGHESWRNALLETPLIDWMLWYERNPSPYKPPYNIIPPNRTEKEFFKLFILPLYANCILILLPITMLIIAKITKRTKPKITNKPLTEPEQKTQNENKTTEPKKKKSETTSRQWSNDGFRIWIDKNGNESEMRLATYSGEKAKFVLRNGKVFAAKLDHFCQEDQEILQEILFGND